MDKIDLIWSIKQLLDEIDLIHQSIGCLIGVMRLISLIDQLIDKIDLIWSINRLLDEIDWLIDCLID